MIYRCPVDGKELADGEPCPEHGIAFARSDDGQTHTTVGKVRRGSVQSDPGSTRKVSSRKRSKA